jgi:endoglucanase
MAPSAGPSASSSPPIDGAPTAPELFANLHLGWNLGNSLDVPEGETAWGNPAVTPQLIQAVADAGFDLVRVPVTWSLYTGAAPGYVIEASQLSRVAEVVGYVEQAGMHAVINLHHDGADGLDGVEWLRLVDPSGQVTQANTDAVIERFTVMWQQIAAHFADHSSRLLFESMNEIHEGYDTPKAEYSPIINQLNQVFVDVVRESGGNNAKRVLVVPGYNTNIDHTIAGFAAPTDPAGQRIALSIHFYDPWSFAGEGATKVWGASNPDSDTWGQEDHVRTQFERLRTTYVEQGIPVLMGEFGAVRNEGFENYRRYYLEYVTQAAAQAGLLPTYWDNGGLGTGADAFGLINRATGEIAFPEIMDALLRATTTTQGLESIAPP